MPKSKTLLLKIITPEKIIFEGEVYEIVLRTLSGEVSIMPDHIPYLSGLKPGLVSLRTTKDGTLQAHCEIKNGFVELSLNELTLLTNEAQIKTK